MGVVTLVGHIVWDWLKSGNRKNGSGDQPPDFWRMEFRIAVREVLRERHEVMESSIDSIIQKLDCLLERTERRSNRR